MERVARALIDRPAAQLRRYVAAEHRGADSVITIAVTYRLGDQDIERAESFDVPDVPVIHSRGSNEATLQAATATASGELRDVLNDLYRELVLANLAKYEGKGGASADPALSAAYPDAETLPGFIRKSGRFNAAGMIFHNVQAHARSGGGYRLLAPVLAALIAGGLSRPRCPLDRAATDSAMLPEEVDSLSTAV
jgi:hypothetical protein